VFLVGLPAGAIADILDRRRLLLLTQGWMLIAATGLSFLTAIDAVNIWVLLAFTFALGLGSAVNTPIWQAVIPELVPRSELPAAVALNGVGINIARAVGPALAGIVVAVIGPEAVFLINAASFMGVMVILYRWKRQPNRSALPAERVLGAMRAGVRYVSHAPALQAVLVRAGVFISCGSALWALLPVLARQDLGLGAAGYGVLLGCLGAGAVGGATVLPKVRRKLSLDGLVIGATIVFAIVTALFAYLRLFTVLCGVMVAGGVAWIALMSSLNAAVQMIVPRWVQARALGMYQIVFQGGMALGSFVWGAVAVRWGTPTTLSFAALGLIIGLIAALRYRLKSGEDLDLTPSLHWPEPTVMIEPRADDGPVMVMLEYCINSEQATAFLQAMHRLKLIRHRDGALSWSVCCDLANPGRYVETFVVESWAEHKRQHGRVTVSDLEIEQQVRAFHIGDVPPIVSHLIYT
jgi:predicted MFS family arabinose efflux permease